MKEISIKKLVGDTIGVKDFVISSKEVSEACSILLDYTFADIDAVDFEFKARVAKKGESYYEAITATKALAIIALVTQNPNPMEQMKLKTLTLYPDHIIVGADKMAYTFAVHNEKLSLVECRCTGYSPMEIDTSPVAINGKEVTSKWVNSVLSMLSKEKLITAKLQSAVNLLVSLKYMSTVADILLNIVMSQEVEVVIDGTRYSLFCDLSSLSKSGLFTQEELEKLRIKYNGTTVSKLLTKSVIEKEIRKKFKVSEVKEKKINVTVEDDKDVQSISEDSGGNEGDTSK